MSIEAAHSSLTGKLSKEVDPVYFFQTKAKPLGLGLGSKLGLTLALA